MSLKRLKRATTDKKSAGHLFIRNLLAQAYPGMRRLEEEGVQCLVDGQVKTLLVDFVLPDLMVTIEVNGRQHKEFVPFFHKNLAGFKAGQVRDTSKRQAIIDAGFSPISIDESELKSLTRSELIQRIQKAIKDKS